MIVAIADHALPGFTASICLSFCSFTVAHQYITAGNFTVAVSVLDKDGGMGSASAQVVVQSPQQGIANLSNALASLGGSTLRNTSAAATARGGLNAGQINSLQVKLDNAAKQLDGGSKDAAKNVLEAFINELQAVATSGRASDSAVTPIVDYAQRVIASIGG